MSLLPRSLIFCAISLCSLAEGNEPYPVVDSASQKARDIDRRAILESELAAEQQALGGAKEALARAPSDDMRSGLHRHEENVKALRRELDRLRDTAPIRVAARPAIRGTTATAKRTPPSPVQAPFWDVYRRSAPPIDSQPPAKELP
jgi:hypothetical protein